MKRLLSFLFIAILNNLITSCTMTGDPENRVVARAGGAFLYEREVEKAIPAGTSVLDSILMARNYIEHWARRALLEEKAVLNLEVEKQNELNELVKSYKQDLFIDAYKEALVNQSLDTIITPTQIVEFYEANKDNFLLNEDLIRLRFIQLNKQSLNKNEIIRKFERYNSSDIEHLDSIRLQFTSYSLNDSAWVRTKQVMDRIKPLNEEVLRESIKKSKFFTLEDAVSIYLIHVTEERFRTEVAPLEYVRATILQILLSKRKLNLIKNLEKDILDDAIKNKDYEIFK